MKKFQLFALSFLSGIFLWIAWPVSPFTFFIFFAWVPLLQVAGKTEKKLHFFFYCFITMLVWNASTTWWLWNATDVGSIGAIVANSLIMTLPWWGYRVFKRKFGERIGYVSLIVFWMSFEYIHLNWQLSWPWLTLGNVFASQTGWIQWYEYTGAGGGTLWVLVVNILLFDIISNWKMGNGKWKIKYTAILFLTLFLPYLFSLLITPKSETIKQLNGQTDNIIIVQPNIDPYNEKFDPGTVSAQIQTLISLSENQLDTNTKMVLWPETALSETVWQDQIHQDAAYAPVFAFVNRHPNITLVTGIETYKRYGNEETTSTAQFNESEQTYYDAFNAAVAIKAGEPFQFYNKSKLVPGVETLPDFLRWMAPLFDKFGGTTAGYGRSPESSVFKTNNNPYVPAPIICYESIYGEYVSTYIKKGANILTIMTNDGWWGNTPGHLQHLDYARLRAIETRKWVVRSANTGVSAVIDDKGDIVQSQPWNKAAFIKAEVPAENGETFYVQEGDLLFKAALIIAFILLVWNIVLIAKKKIFSKNIT